jgi:C1A family cysteine protease
MINKRFGWRPQKPDHRDHKFTLEKLAPLQSVYLSDKYSLSTPYDQGDLGSCTANALAFACHFDLLNKDISGNKVAPFRPSRLFIYYYERVLEGTVSTDAGAEIRDGIKVIASNGIPSEDAWPYNIAQFAVTPSALASSYAAKLHGFKYESVDNTDKALIVGALTLGLPVVFGVTVYESFMTDQVAATGIVPYPGQNETVAGGHAMVIVGYHAEDDSFIVRNSWGTNWGQGGYCRIPASYLCNADLATDFWVVYTLSAN